MSHEALAYSASVPRIRRDRDGGLRRRGSPGSPDIVDGAFVDPDCSRVRHGTADVDSDEHGRSLPD